MAKITQVIDSQLWQENLEEQIILKKFRAKKTTLSTTADKSFAKEINYVNIQILQKEVIAAIT